MTSSEGASNIRVSALGRADVAVAPAPVNDLESAAIQIDPGVKKLKEGLLELGGRDRPGLEELAGAPVLALRIEQGRAGASEQLTTLELRGLNLEVADEEPVDEVARRWLLARGLLARS